MISTICESSEISEEDGHIEVHTEAKEECGECHTYSTVHQDALLAVFITQPAPKITANKNTK